MNRYPDMGSVALYQALSDKLDVPVERPLARHRLGRADLPAGAGLLRARRRGRLRVALLRGLPDRGHRRGRHRRSRCRSLADGRHDLDAMAAAITDRTKVVLVCTPNNPTGPAVTQAELDAFLAKVPPHVLVVVDEAYVEFVRMADPVDGLATYRRHENVVLTRTFSKAYGLAGFRVGYAVAPEPIAGGAAGGVAAVRRLDRRAGRGDRLAGARRTSCSSGSTPWSPSATGSSSSWRAAGWDVPGAAGQLRVVRARGADPGLRGRRRRGSASWSARSPARACRVSIGETEANDRLIKAGRGLPALTGRSASAPHDRLGRRPAAVHLPPAAGRPPAAW